MGVRNSQEFGCYLYLIWISSCAHILLVHFQDFSKQNRIDAINVGFNLENDPV